MSIKLSDLPAAVPPRLPAPMRTWHQATRLCPHFRRIEANAYLPATATLPHRLTYQPRPGVTDTLRWDDDSGTRFFPDFTEARNWVLQTYSEEINRLTLEQARVINLQSF